ncbi:MAG: Na+/H+ antiporter NhaA [Spirochaetes bacterium]|nr:Na+/H+ antiporter NhaA [Spirochaetota bacterium]
MTWHHVFHSETIVIAAGPFIGKQIGIFFFCFVAQKLKIASLSHGTMWQMLYGTSLFYGIGFTMSLFFSTLAFEATGEKMLFDERIGSLLPRVAGYSVLALSSRSSLPAE